MPLKSVKSQEEFNAAVGRHASGSTPSTAVTAAVHFWAEWCEPSKHMDTVFEQLASENPHANFVRVCVVSLEVEQGSCKYLTSLFAETG